MDRYYSNPSTHNSHHTFTMSSNLLFIFIGRLYGFKSKCQSLWRLLCNSSMYALSPFKFYYVYPAAILTWQQVILTTLMRCFIVFIWFLFLFVFFLFSLRFQTSFHSDKARILVGNRSREFITFIVNNIILIDDRLEFLAVAIQSNRLDYH